jgi:glycosyltransferase involved in cell wall biosynthesis
VLDSLSVGDAKGTVIYAGQTDPPATTAPDLRARLSLPQDARLVGYVGRIAHVKALDVLAKAAQRVVSTAPQVHFVLFGEALFGQTGYKQALVEQVASIGIGDHWHWLGYTQDVSSYLSQIDCLTLPSRREALGLALLEAGIAGKPAVGTHVGGIPEVIVDGETGILVPPEDSEALAAAILHLLQNPLQAEEMGRRAQAHVRDVFSLPRYYTEFIALYDSILDSRENPVRL